MLKYLLAFLLLLVVASPVYAAPGAGLVYGLESQVVESNQKFCVTYGVYNPFDIDSQIELGAEGEILDFVESTDTKFVAAGTLKDDAVEAQICFKSPDIRVENCAIPGILCKYECSITSKSYDGQVLASPDVPNELTASGSAVGMSIAAPFSILVKCEESDYNYIPLVLIIGGIAAFVFMLIILRRRHKDHHQDRAQAQYNQWQQYQRPPAQQPAQPQQQYQQPAQPQQQYQQPQQPQPGQWQPPQNP